MTENVKRRVWIYQRSK